MSSAATANMEVEEAEEQDRRNFRVFAASVRQLWRTARLTDLGAVTDHGSMMVRWTKRRRATWKPARYETERPSPSYLIDVGTWGGAEQADDLDSPSGRKTIECSRRNTREASTRIS
jgi:hypothetical protein